MEQVLFPCLPSRKLAQLSAERTPSLGPGPLLPGRTVGAATPRPQAPGRCLRDHLAAQLTRAPGRRHTWGRKAGREGTGLCLLVVRGGWGPETSPAGQGHNGAGAHHRLPDGRAGEPHVTEHVSKAPESPTGLETETHHKSERRRLLLLAHRQQSRATRNTKNREPWLRPGRQRNCRNTGDLQAPLLWKITALKQLSELTFHKVPRAQNRKGQSLQ